MVTGRGSLARDPEGSRVQSPAASPVSCRLFRQLDGPQGRVLPGGRRTPEGLGLITHRHACVWTRTHTHLNVSGYEDSTSGQWPHPAWHPISGRKSGSSRDHSPHELAQGQGGQHAVCRPSGPIRARAMCRPSGPVCAPCAGPRGPSVALGLPSNKPFTEVIAENMVTRRDGQAAPGQQEAPCSGVDRAPHSWLRVPAASAAATCCPLGAHILDALTSTPRPPPQTSLQPATLSTQQMCAGRLASSFVHPLSPRWTCTE